MSADIPTRFIILVLGDEKFTNELHEGKITRMELNSEK